MTQLAEKTREGYCYESLLPSLAYLRRSNPKEPVEAVFIVDGQQFVFVLTGPQLSAIARDSTAFHFAASVKWEEMWAGKFHRPELL